MARKYTYQQRCPIARSLDVVGDRWSLLVVRNLERGHSKFVDLMRELRGIAPNSLSERLKLLEDAGVITSTLYSNHPPRAEYSLTEKGRALLPVLDALSEWGNTHAPRQPGTEAAGAPSESVADTR
ncbi:MAG: helix-turn-helix domain-containing protein [Chloroflexi bacterium]|nr:helix-turn-helix domain-containing protein [Chloroflexota bacterium]MDA1239209.1 helix-turn-helix domain-containing protein [Chloroflexota bacterium]